MPLAIYTSAAWTANGGIEPAAGATVEVRSETTGSLVLLFEDRDSEVGLDNPFNADAQGRFAFFVAGGAYRVKVTDGENEHTLRYQAVGTAAERDTGTGDDEVPDNAAIDSRGFAQSVDSVSDLQSGSFPTSLKRLWLAGYYGVGTAGGGPLYRDSDDTTTADNGVTVFVDADGVRWKRQVALLRSNEIGFSVGDAIWSWWTSPKYVRHISETQSRSYLTLTGSKGAAGVAEVNHTTGRVKRRTISDSFSPDDHNAGSVCVGDGRLALFLPGRRYGDGSMASIYVSESDSLDINDLPSTLEDIGIGGNYPQPWNVDGDFFILARDSTDGGDVQWRYRLNTWPLTSFGETGDFFSSQKEWPYFLTRRSGADKGAINFGFAWHPNNEPTADLYVGKIVHGGGDDPWDVISNGSVIGNLSTGEGLPFDETALEIVYSAEDDEKTRLLDVHDDCIAFAVFPSGDDPVAQYKYAFKSEGSWTVVDIVSAGRAFYPSVKYFGGVSINEQDNRSLVVSREEDGRWFVENYKIEDGEAVFKGVVYHGGTPRKVAVAARPFAEVLSEESHGRDGESVLGSAFHVGRYNPTTARDFNTKLVSTGTGAVIASDEYEEDSIGESISSSECNPLAHRSFIAGSRDCTVSRGSSSRNSTIEGSDECQIVSGKLSFIGASLESEIDSSGANNFLLGARNSSIETDGNANAVIGSAGSNIKGSLSLSLITSSVDCSIDGVSRATVTGSDNCSVSGTHGVALGSRDSEVTGDFSSLLGSRISTVTHGNTHIIGGLRVASYSSETITGGKGDSGEASSANRKFEIKTDTGDINLAGAITENVDFSDIAKMLKNGEGEEIEPGYLLSLIGDRVYKAERGERVDAIVAATPGIIQNDTPFTWQGRYLKDEWGRIKYKKVDWVRFDGYEGLLSEAPENIPSDAVYSTESIPVENPDYDPNASQVPRSERPDEWVMAGVHGVVRTRVDGSVTQAAVDQAAADRQVMYVEAGEVPGIGQLAQCATNVQVMCVEKEFDGYYGIARCLIR